MNIELNSKEVGEILREKFPKASFRVYYFEPEEIWEQRNGKKIKDLKSAPEPPLETYCLYF